MLPLLTSLAPILPYAGLLSALLGAYAWLRDFRGEVRSIKDNHLPHIQRAAEDTKASVEGLRADFRTYFAPHSSGAPVTITVSPSNVNEVAIKEPER